MMDLYFTGAGLLICIYQAYRGFVFQWLYGNQHRHQWKTTTNIVMLLCLADALFYFACALLGCLSISLIFHLVFNGPPLWEMSASTLAFIGVLAFLGLTGITGQLPSMIQRWKPALPGAAP